MPKKAAKKGASSEETWGEEALPEIEKKKLHHVTLSFSLFLSTSSAEYKKSLSHALC